MKNALANILLLLAGVISLIFMPMAAIAAEYSSDLSCQAITDVSTGVTYYQPAPYTELFNTRIFRATEAPRYTGVCSNATVQAEPENGIQADDTRLTTKVAPVIFSWILCNFILTINDVMGKLYCGFYYAMTDVLAALFTLLIAVFGFQLLTGSARMTAKEYLTRLLKMAFIWVFVTQSVWGVSLIFNFFFTMAGEGSTWVLDGILKSDAYASSTPDPSGMTLASLKNKYGSGGLYSGTGFIDDVIYYSVVGPFTMASSKLLGFFAALCLVFPPIFIMAVYWLWNNFMIAVRAMATFMLGMSALGFLVALSPIFLSFMLFQVTFHFFESWLKYLTSFVLQIILVFAVVALWLAVNSYFIGFFNNLSDVIFPYQKIRTESAQSEISDSWGICPYTFSVSAADSLYGPRIVCKNPAFDPQRNAIDKSNVISMEGLQQESKNCDLTDPRCNKGFLYYLIYNLITLLIIGYAFTGLVKNAPSIAQELAGPNYVPMLGQGFGYSSASAAKGIARIDKNLAGNSLFSLGNTRKVANFGRGNSVEPEATEQMKPTTTARD